MTMVRRLRDRARPRREMYRFYAELYGVSELSGLGLTSYDPAGVGFVAPTLPFNVVRRGVKTILAKVAKNRPVPMILTERGDYAQAKRAKGLTNFIAGAFQAIKVYEHTRPLLRDALVFGTGIGKIYHCDGDELPRFDRIFPWEIFTDVADAREGHPKQIFIIRWMDRTVLKELYPDHAEAIETCRNDSGLIEDMPDVEQDGDLVLVTEAWRLPTRAGGVPGRHAIAIDGVTLYEEEWTRDKFPFVFVRYDDPVLGFWGESLAGEMAGFQYEVNYVTETLRMAHRVAPTGIWIVDDTAGIPDAYFQNEVGMVFRKRPGAQVTYESPTPANPQTYQWLQTCADGSLQWTGISTMSANATKPAGITAAKALQTLDDIEADNFALLEQAWEQLHMDVAELLIDEFKELHEENPDLQVFYPEKRSLLAVKWAEVNLGRDAIVMQVWPTKLLGRTPSSRLQMVNDLFNAGIIDKTRYLQLLDAPDVDAETDLETAAQVVADEQIEAMLDAEDAETAYRRPGPYQDLVYAMHRAQQQINLGEMRGVPEPNLDLLRKYIEDCQAELDKKNPPQPPNQLQMAPVAPPGMAPAAPAPMAPMAPPMGGPTMPAGPPGPPIPGPMPQ